MLQEIYETLKKRQGDPIITMKATKDVGINVGINEQKVLELLRKNNQITAKEITGLLGISRTPDHIIKAKRYDSASWIKQKRILGNYSKIRLLFISNLHQSKPYHNPDHLTHASDQCRIDSISSGKGKPAYRKGKSSLTATQLHRQEEQKIGQ
jgi:hypothetical protein